MLIKIIGAVIVIIATAMIGYSYASKLEKRKRTLGDFASALTMLETEINFASNPLKYAFSAISRALDSTVGTFFSDLADSMDGGRIGVKRLWDETLAIYVPVMSLTASDVEVISAFAMQLGMTDRESQLKNIAHTKTLLSAQISNAGDACNKNKKIYQSAGILSGCLIAILLF